MAGYGTDEGLDTWLAERGLSWPEGDGAPTRAVARQNGSDYVDNVYGAMFPGTPTGGFDQDRAWPRDDASAWYGLREVSIPNGTTPKAIEQASYAAAWQDQLAPGSLSVVVLASERVKREKVAGVIETEYFEGSGDAVKDSLPMLSTVAGILAPFLVNVADAPAVGIWAVGGATCE